MVDSSSAGSTITIKHFSFSYKMNWFFGNLPERVDRGIPKNFAHSVTESIYFNIVPPEERSATTFFFLPPYLLPPRYLFSDRIQMLPFSLYS